MKTLKSWEEVERILRDRIKFIGDNEQIYTGCPADLLKELRQAFQQEIRQANIDGMEMAIDIFDSDYDPLTYRGRVKDAIVKFYKSKS